MAPIPTRAAINLLPPGPPADWRWVSTYNKAREQGNSHDYIMSNWNDAMDYVSTNHPRTTEGFRRCRTLIRWYRLLFDLNANVPDSFRNESLDQRVDPSQPIRNENASSGGSYASALGNGNRSNTSRQPTTNGFAFRPGNTIRSVQGQRSTQDNRTSRPVVPLPIYEPKPGAKMNVIAVKPQLPRRDNLKNVDPSKAGMPKGYKKFFIVDKDVGAPPYSVVTADVVAAYRNYVGPGKKYVTEIEKVFGLRFLHEIVLIKNADGIFVEHFVGFLEDRTYWTAGEARIDRAFKLLAGWANHDFWMPIIQYYIDVFSADDG